MFDWFSGDEPRFDLCRLDDSTVITADKDDLIAPIRHGLELIVQSDTLQAVANGASREFIEAITEAVEGGQTHALILPRETIDAFRADPALRGDVRAMLEWEGMALLCSEGDEELPVMQIGDETVSLCSGNHRAMIETDDETVCEWAESYFASLRADAISVSLEAFVDEAVTAEDEAFVE